MKFLHTELFVLGIAFFVLSVVEGSPAQTRVCSGDSVVLVLNGYKQGSTIWQQSSDRTTWSAVQGTTDNDSLALTAKNTYYYQAIVVDGSCSPFYSDTELVIVNPNPPIAKSATGITFDGFNANWTPVHSPGDTAYYTYYLDVSTVPTFASFVTGYNNLYVTDTISFIDPVLFCNTTYYYRVRSHNGHCGTSSNSNTITVTTDTCPRPIYCTFESTCNGNITDSRDNKVYKTVQIGAQCWMAQNLNVGTAIPGVVQQTNNTIIEKYCYDYGGTTTDSIKCATYGGLYLWAEMMDYAASKIDAPGPKGICPTGWHIPTDEEWKCLEMTLGMTEAQADGDRTNTTVGNKLKTKGNGAPPLWASPSAGTDTSHFSSLPGGNSAGDGLFNDVGHVAYFWTATEGGAGEAWARLLYYFNAQVHRDYYNVALNGYSARCVKD